MSYAEWRHEFPDDTPQTYLDQYALATDPGGRLAEVYVALSDDDRICGLGTLVDDDELPDTTEPGPWLAALWVRPEERGRGLGAAIVATIVERARALGVPRLYLYTEDRTDWYSSMGWRRLRSGAVNDLPVTVMSLDL